ncbi:jg22690, partial [Pararge aegeria aegeria]
MFQGGSASRGAYGVSGRAAANPPWLLLQAGLLVHVRGGGSRGGRVRGGWRGTFGLPHREGWSPTRRKLETGSFYRLKEIATRRMASCLGESAAATLETLASTSTSPSFAPGLTTRCSLENLTP